MRMRLTWPRLLVVLALLIALAAALVAWLNVRGEDALVGSADSLARPLPLACGSVPP